MVRTRKVEKKKDFASSIWFVSDTIIRELSEDAILFGELVSALKKDKERYLFIPWSQWPHPGKRVVENIERIISRLLRTSRTLRVYVVPDEIAALCLEYQELDDGKQEYIYRHLIHDNLTMEGVRKRLSRDIELIEAHFKKTGANNSFNGIARCY